jgi:hypothetical protein
MTDKVKGVRAVDTLPGIVLEIDKARAEMKDIRSALAEVMKAEKHIPREALGGKSYAEKIDTVQAYIDGLELEMRKRAAFPLQTVFDFETFSMPTAGETR